MIRSTYSALFTALALAWTQCGPASSNNSLCPEGWSKFNQNCYSVFGGQQNFAQAQETCKFNMADLVEIESTAEHDFVASLARAASVDNAYIGLTDRAREGQYVWVTNGRVANFTAWASGRPDNYIDDEDCVHVGKYYNYRWNDVACNFPLDACICEMLLEF